MSRGGAAKFAYGAAWAVLVLVMVGVGVAAYLQHTQKRAEARTPAVLGEVPVFWAINEKGERVTRDSLRGTVWVTDFIFSYCGGQCPLMTSKMRELQEWMRAKDVRGVKLLSFSVDPDRDTTTVLSEYSERFKADPQRWDFLTGDRKEIHRLARHGFKLGVDDNPSTGTAPEEEPIIHSNRFVLVDAHSRIRGYYNSDDAAALKQLRQDIESLAHQ